MNLLKKIPIKYGGDLHDVRSQYQLLFAANVADGHNLRMLIGRPPSSATPFFKKEFNDAAH